MGSIIDRLEYTVKNWWMSLVLGLLYVILAICIMFTPITSYLAISILFSISLFVGGILEITFGLSNRNRIKGWGWYLGGGIIDLLIGLFLLFNPAVSMGILPYVLAFWLMFRGFSIVGYAIDLKRCGAGNWGWALFFGILAVLCSMWVIWQPAVGAFSIVYVLAYILLFIGIFRIVLAFELKKLRKRYTMEPEELV